MFAYVVIQLTSFFIRFRLNGGLNFGRSQDWDGSRCNTWCCITCLGTTCCAWFNVNWFSNNFYKRTLCPTRTEINCSRFDIVKQWWSTTSKCIEFSQINVFFKITNNLAPVMIFNTIWSNNRGNSCEWLGCMSLMKFDTVAWGSTCKYLPHKNNTSLGYY